MQCLHVNLCRFCGLKEKIRKRKKKEKETRKEKNQKKRIKNKEINKEKEPKRNAKRVRAREAKKQNFCTQATKCAKHHLNTSTPYGVIHLVSISGAHKFAEK